MEDALEFAAVVGDVGSDADALDDLLFAVSEVVAPVFVGVVLISELGRGYACPAGRLDRITDQRSIQAVRGRAGLPA